MAQIDVLETMTPAPVHQLPRPARSGQRVPVRPVPSARGRPRSAGSRRPAGLVPEPSEARERIAAALGRRRVRLVPGVPGPAGVPRPASELERDVTRPRPPSAEVQTVLLRGVPTTMASQPRSPSASSTWTRACRSGGTGTSRWSSGRSGPEGHRWLGGRGLPADDALHPDLPRSVGRAQPRLGKPEQGSPSGFLDRASAVRIS